MTSAQTGFDAESFDSVEDHQRRNEGGELSVTCVLQFLGIGFQKESTNISTRNIGCFGDKFPTVMANPGLAHTRAL
jgi:hypothetical protein